MRRRSLLFARLALRRRALVYWVGTAVLAAATALAIGGVAARAERAAARYGDLRPVVVAVEPIEAGDEVEAGAVEVRSMPAAFVPDGAFEAWPNGRTAIAATHPGEPLLAHRVAPDGVNGIAALLPQGTRALAIPVGPGALPLAAGDVVDVLAAAEVAEAVATGALVVDVAAETVTVAVDEADAPEVAAALAQGTVTLALSSEGP